MLEEDGTVMKWEKLPDIIKKRPESLFEFNAIKVAVENLKQTNGVTVKCVHNKKFVELSSGNENWAKIYLNYTPNL